MADGGCEMENIRKMMKQLFFILILMSMTMQAQVVDNETVLTKARTAYEDGDFARVDTLLTERASGMKNQYKVEALKLLSLSNFYMDSPEQARYWAHQLLAEDPYYTAYGENPRFQDMMESLKVSGATITTASSQSESLEESPVPITLITEEMIRISGAKTLRDLLVLYVPGMVAVDGVENNVALRGLYGYTQEQILVMEDGHRLNSYMTHAEGMDYDITLEKVRQIEVLRGPASSLYGNVAVSGVVNIITKTGQKVAGAQLSAKAGSYGTYGGTFLYGGGTLKTDILFWGALHYAQGEYGKDPETGITLINGGYNHMPAWDFGLKARWSDFKITATVRHNKQVPYYNVMGFGYPWTYGKYDDQNENGPGVSHTRFGLNLDYNHTWGNFTLTGNILMDYERSQLYNVMGDKVDKFLMDRLLAILEMPLDPDTIGVWQTINWTNMTFGGRLTGSYSYKAGRQSGNILVGAQYERFALTGSNFQVGSMYEYVQLQSPLAITKDSETTASGFVQVKHYFLPQLILNGGLRYDYKSRFLNKYDPGREDYPDRQTNTFSPRVSVIWLPSKKVSARLSYAHSYVDAPYFYRACIIKLLSGGTELKAQSLDALQLGATYSLPRYGLKLEGNIFYNMSEGVVVYSPANLMRQSEYKQLTPFSNAGKVNIGGIELSAHWDRKGRTIIHGNMTYQYGFKLEDYGVSSQHEIGNIPRFMMNMVAAQKFAIPRLAGDFWVRGNLHVQSSALLVQNNYVTIFMTGKTPMVPSGAQAMLNLGVDWNSPSYRWGGVYASLDFYNVTNSDYKVGTLQESWKPSLGFHVIGKVGVRF